MTGTGYGGRSDSLMTGTSYGGKSDSLMTDTGYGGRRSDSLMTGMEGEEVTAS